MSRLKILIPALLVFAAVPAVSEAQVSVPFVKTTYSVQVQKEFWRNGSTYWLTVFQTENLEDAELMFELLSDALEAGQICEYLDCGFDWIIRDVRLVARHEYPYLERLQYNRELLYRNPSDLTIRK